MQEEEKKTPESIHVTTPKGEYFISAMPPLGAEGETLKAIPQPVQKEMISKIRNPYNPETEPASWRWFNERPINEVTPPLQDTGKSAQEAATDYAKSHTEIDRTRFEAIEDAFISGSLYASRRQTEWVNIKDEQPKHGTDLFVHDIEDNQTYSYFNYNGAMDDFSHWMPLPTPPTK